MTDAHLLRREVAVNVAGAVGLVLPLLAVYADTAGSVAYLGVVWAVLLLGLHLWVLPAAVLALALGGALLARSRPRAGRALVRTACWTNFVVWVPLLGIASIASAAALLA